MTTEEAIDFARGLPCWQGPLRLEVLGGGITNVNLKAIDASGAYVVRIGEDIPAHHVMRWNELSIGRAAEAAGISPRIHFHAPGAMVMEFVESETWAEADVRDCSNLTRAVDLVRRVHTEVVRYLRGPVLTFWVFHVIRDYAATLREAGSTYVADLPAMLNTAQGLEAKVGRIDLVLGHNDLLAANFLDQGNRLWLIDWEYGGFNSPLFDLGGLATNNGLSDKQEQAMLDQYFDGDPPPLSSYYAMKCASLMRETMWSMVSEIYSDLDFDYAAYTAENRNRLNMALQDLANA